MARPITYDRNAVLEAARNIFWKKGYADTSIADLEKATGLVRTSLYAAFGNKSKLYLETLKDYTSQGQAIISTSFDQDLDPLEQIKSFISHSIINGCAINKGCYAVSSSNEMYDKCKETRQIISNNKEAIILHYETFLNKAKDSSKLTTPTDIKALAKYIYVLQTGLMSSARSGTSKKDLLESLEIGFSMIQ